MRPTVLGKYEILHRVAVGGMGEVFLARQLGVPGFERRVIVKSLLPRDGADFDAMRMRFLDEARVAAHLNHPNVVSIVEAGVWEGTLLIVMEYINGWNLSQLGRELARAGLTLSPVHASLIVHDAAAGLHHAHCARDASGRRLDIVHRDVSPQNIMVRTDGLAKVVDFGVAWARFRDSKTRTGAVVGKVTYMPPEQLRGETVDARGDQFALGVVFWELLTGRALFDGTNDAELADAVLRCEVEHPSAVSPAVPRELGAIAMRMLRPAAADRYPDCAAVVDAIDRVLASFPTGSTRDELVRVLGRLGVVPAERAPPRGLSDGLGPAAMPPAEPTTEPALSGTAPVPLTSTVGARPSNVRARGWGWKVPAALLVAAAVAAGGIWSWRVAGSDPSNLPADSDSFAPELPPVPPPEDTPFVTAWGVDPGSDAPLTADRVALRALMEARQFDALEQAFARYQAAYEADVRREAWPKDALDAFGADLPGDRDHLEAWARDRPQSFAAVGALGAHLAAARDFEGARRDLQRSLELRPSFFPARLYLLRMAREEERPAEAEAQLRAALARDPGLFFVRYEYLHALSEGEVETRGPAALESLPVDRNPALVALEGHAWWGACETAAWSGDEARALEDCARAGAAPGPLAALAEVQLRAGDAAAARALAERAIRIDRYALGALVARANAVLALQRPDEAVDAAIEVLRLWPAHPTVRRLAHTVAWDLLARAEALEVGGALEHALLGYRRALTLDANHAPGRTRLALALARSGRGEDATAELRRVLALDPGMMALKDHGSTLVLDGRVDDAEALWSLALQVSADQVEALEARARVRAKLGRRQDSEQDFRRACELGLKRACDESRPEAPAGR